MNNYLADMRKVNSFSLSVFLLFYLNNFFVCSPNKILLKLLDNFN